jgi:hypothetical protein
MKGEKPIREKMWSANYKQFCGSGPFWSDPDVWDRIRILALINDPTLSQTDFRNGN